MAQVPAGSLIGLAYAHISGAATTTVKAAPGAMMKLIINSAAVGSITVYDNTAGSGAVVGIITVSTAITVPTVWFSGDIAVTFKTGLTIVTTAACDLTILYR